MVSHVTIIHLFILKKFKDAAELEDIRSHANPYAYAFGDDEGQKKVK